MGRATKQRGDQDGQRDGKRDDKNTSTRMTRTKAVVTLAVLFLLASAAGTPTFAAEDVEVKNNDALAALAQQMISTEGVLENVTMNITGGVTDLTPLSGLKHIKNGGLEVTNTMNLVSLAPLENLEVVDGNLAISYNAALTAISLPSLTEVGGLLVIAENAALTGISLPSLTEVGGWYLGIMKNAALARISLPSLTEVADLILLEGNAALTDLSLPSLTEVGGHLGISYNAALAGISLPSLTEVGGYLAIDYNDALTAISLPSLTEVGGWLAIYRNAALAGISLPSLTEVVGGSLEIYENAALPGISLPSLTEVAKLLLKENDALASFDFPSLESAPSGFFVVENALLLNYQENPFGPMKGISMKVKDSEEAKPAIEGSSSINAQLRSGYYTLEEEIDASGEVVPGELVHHAAAGGSPGLGRKLLGGRS